MKRYGRDNVMRKLLMLLGLLALAGTAQAQFNYVTNNGAITITGYTGTDRSVYFPSVIGRRWVTTIGGSVFQYATVQPTKVYIPYSVKSIASTAFLGATSLKTINVMPVNPIFSSVGGILFDRKMKNLLSFPPDKAGAHYTIPNGVTNVGDYAFCGNLHLTSLKMPKSVRTIGFMSVAGCINLTNVFFTNGLIRIGDEAFENNNSLNSINFPNTLKYVGNLAFFDCGNLGKVVIPPNISSIGYEVFSYCDSLTNVNISGSITNVGSAVFWGCKALNKLVISNGITAISYGMFFECGKLADIKLPDSIKSIGQFAFSECLGITNINIPDNCTNIGYAAFAECVQLRSITIPDSVIYVDSDAFYRCLSLTNIVIGRGVTNIGVQAFSDCPILISINVDDLNPAYSSKDGVWFNKDQTVLIKYPSGKVGDYSVPNTVINIGYDGFFEANGLTSLIISDSVVDIGVFAFFGAVNLSSVHIGAGVTNIGSSAFYDCGNLTSINIPDKVTNIKDDTFSSCYSLINITIPSSVTNIGADAFGYCLGLQGIWFMGDAPTVDSSAFTLSPATAYYLAGTTGWEPTLAGIPTMLWSPPASTITAIPAVLTVKPNVPVFKIPWSGSETVVIEACTNLFNAVWIPVQTNTVTGSEVNFSDPQSGNFPNRFYRLRSP